VDWLWLGLGEAAALVPGVSRTGATLAAARSRGFSRIAAHRLSRYAGLPVIAGATLLKTVRLAEHGADGETRRRLGAGAAAAFVSTLGAAQLIPWLERDRPLWPYAAYRAGLAMIVLRRLANGTSGRCSTMRL
jgi:undecaprenyl-diphosphatase